jgi:phosphoadenosine phosphosulfate reductase
MSVDFVPPLLDQAALSVLTEVADPSVVLAAVEARFGDRAAIATSFGVEDIVLMHLAKAHAPSARFFTLDTGRLHQETYEVMDAFRRRFGVAIDVYAPETKAVEALVGAHGPMSFRDGVSERKACCAIRKLEPLKRALAGKAAWVTGLRREQADSRANVDVVSFDDAWGLWKFNPLAALTKADVWAYVREYRLPYNRLHDVGYPSIGCAPCTRAVAATEDDRAGRWWWEQLEHKECGLHAR